MAEALPALELVVGDLADQLRPDADPLALLALLAPRPPRLPTGHARPVLGLPAVPELLGALAERLQRLLQLAARGRVEGGGVADVMELALVVVKPEQQRS